MKSESDQKDHEAIAAATRFLSKTKDSVCMIMIPRQFPQAVSAILDSDKIVTTGLGKAGHAARKAASSFCSLGFQSCYLSPSEASHGDVGIIAPGDCLLVFSTSGKTREVLETIDLAQKLGIHKVIVITSHIDSPIRKAADVILDMGDIVEAGYLGLAPTTSILVMLIIADMLALVCAEMSEITVEKFGLRHHGGYLGRKCRGEEQ